MGRWTFTALCLAAILGIGIATNWLTNTNNAETWYVQVDNTAMHQKSKVDAENSFEYEYTLPAADREGTTHKVNFTSSHVLRNGAYLELTCMPVRGVVGWSEVPPERVPNAAIKLIAA